MISDCASCGLFSVAQDSEECVHTNRPGGLIVTERAFALCGFPAQAHILDVACGTGATVNYLADKPGLKALGMDRSGKALAGAQSEPARLNLLRGDVLRIPIAPGYFDGVFMECALSLTFEPLHCLVEIMRVLKPGGKVVLTDIYLREVIGDDFKQVLSVSTCLAGAMTQEEVENLIAAAGLRTLAWEDHTALLKQWMVGQIFRLGSITKVFCQLSAENAQNEEYAQALNHIRLGYYLAIFEKPLALETPEVNDG